MAYCLLALSSCGDGGGAILTPGDDDDDPPPAECTGTNCGDVVIALTDGDGDFLSYTVDVLSIELEDEDGDTVDVLPEPQRVDFAELTDVSELVSLASVPNGSYVAATIRLDYAEALVSVEVDGLPTGATVVNVDGDPVGEVEVTIEFDSANEVTVASGATAFLQLDFDLEASHEVNLGTTPVTVTAEPFVVAMTEPLDTREFRVRGPLGSVDEAGGSYVIDIRPFYDQNARHGELTIETDDAVACEILGDEREGADCLARLADLPENTMTLAHGAFDAATGVFTAERVLAGDSVPGEGFDTAIGVVVARNLDTLVLRGGTLVSADGEAEFIAGDIEVTMGPGTEVTRDGGGPAGLDLDSISVGQRIQAFGERNTFRPDEEIIATGGRVRQHESELTGTIVSAVSDDLVLSLFSIDGRDPQFFDFDGTGTSLITEADFQNYEVNAGQIDITDFADGDGAAAFGFVAAFGTAPPDFRAASLVDFEELRALLGVGWGFDGTPAPFLSMGQSGFVIDVTNIDLGNRQFLEIGPFVFDITSDLPEPITVEPADAGKQLYAVARELDVEIFSDFGDFASRVNSLLNGGNDMRSFTARGTFDEDTTTLEANYVAISFAAP